MIEYKPNEYNFGDNVLERTVINGRRHYLVEGVPLPSVTTVLGFKPKPELAAWRERVGEEKAHLISKQATFRGNELHEMCENYILKGDANTKKYMPINVEMFMWIKEQLDKHLTVAYGSEVRLYSLALGVAGTADLLGQWDGVDSIIDFKTSTKSKKASWISDYFKQEATYSFMAYERSAAHGKPFFPKQLVTLVATEATKSCDVFIQRAGPWLDKAIETIEEYQKFIVEGG